MVHVESSADARFNVPDPDNFRLGIDGQEAAVGGKDKRWIVNSIANSNVNSNVSIVSEIWRGRKRWKRRNQPAHGPKLTIPGLSSEAAART